LGIKSVNEKLQSIVLSLNNTLSEVGIENVLGFLQVGEYQLGFEVLCDILHEDDIAVPQNVYEELVCIGKALKIDKTYWENLLVEKNQ
jgi:hypothetical protein